MNPLQTQCLQGFFLFSLWKNLWMVWKTYVDQWFS